MKTIIIIISIIVFLFASFGCDGINPTSKKGIIGEWVNINPGIKERIEFFEDGKFYFHSITGKWHFLNDGRIKLIYYEDVEAFASFQGDKLKIDAPHLTNGIFQRVSKGKKTTQKGSLGRNGASSSRKR